METKHNVNHQKNEDEKFLENFDDQKLIDSIYKNPLKAIANSVNLMIVFFMIGIFFIFHPIGCSATIPESMSELGDSVGILNAFFSSLAFAVLIITMFLQREDLKQQRKEFVDMKEENQLQTQQFKIQNQNMEKQIFSGLFFSALNEINNIKIGMEKSYDSTLKFPKQLRDEMQKVILRKIGIMLNKFQSDTYKKMIFDNMTLKSNFQDFALVCYNGSTELIDYLFIYTHYMLMNQKILSIIVESNLDTKDKKNYVELWFNRLSTDEKALIYFALIFDKIMPTSRHEEFYNTFFLVYELHLQMRKNDFLIKFELDNFANPITHYLNLDNDKLS